MLIIVLLTANCEVYEKDGNIIKTLSVVVQLWGNIANEDSF